MSKLDEEIKFITVALGNNGFPLDLIQSVVGIKISNFNKIKPTSAKNMSCLSTPPLASYY